MTDHVAAKHTPMGVGGVYGFWVCISIREWKAKHTHFAT